MLLRIKVSKKGTSLYNFLSSLSLPCSFSVFIAVPIELNEAQLAPIPSPIMFPVGKLLIKELTETAFVVFIQQEKKLCLFLYFVYNL